VKASGIFRYARFLIFTTLNQGGWPDPVRKDERGRWGKIGFTKKGESGNVSGVIIQIQYQGRGSDFVTFPPPTPPQHLPVLSEKSRILSRENEENPVL
jgi:hypothetical protein